MNMASLKPISTQRPDRTRANGFLDEYTRPLEKRAVHENMTGSAELSALISRLNQVSAQSKNISVTPEHLVVFAETIIILLDKFLVEIGRKKAS